MERPVEAKQKTLIVEGWRFLPHSYAIVNQWQLLALSRRPGVALKTVALPINVKRWKQQEGFFDPFEEQRLRDIEIATEQDRADVTLRISFPFDFSRSRSP